MPDIQARAGQLQLDEEQPRRSKQYYCQNVTFRVENELFCIPKTCMTDHSEVFEDMFSLESTSEGQSDENPIVLEGYKIQDFESLLKVVLPRRLSISPPDLKKEEWVGVLKLSTIWQMHEVRKLAIDKLSKLGLSPMEKIILARAHQVSPWLSEGTQTLAQAIDDYSIEELASAVGWETTARLLLAGRDPRHKEQIVSLSAFQCTNCSAPSMTTDENGQPFCSTFTQCKAATVFRISGPLKSASFKASSLKCAEHSCFTGVYSPETGKCSVCNKDTRLFKVDKSCISTDTGPNLSAAIGKLFGEEIETLQTY